MYSGGFSITTQVADIVLTCVPTPMTLVFSRRRCRKESQQQSTPRPWDVYYNSTSTSCKTSPACNASAPSSCRTRGRRRGRRYPHVVRFQHLFEWKFCIALNPQSKTVFTRFCASIYSLPTCLFPSLISLRSAVSSGVDPCVIALAMEPPCLALPASFMVRKSEPRRSLELSNGTDLSAMPTAPTAYHPRGIDSWIEYSSICPHRTSAPYPRIHSSVFMHPPYPF